jgi:hypothetical protein
MSIHFIAENSPCRDFMPAARVPVLREELEVIKRAFGTLSLRRVMRSRIQP